MAKPHTSIKALKRAIKKTPGVKFRATKSGHYQVITDDDPPFVIGTFPSTPSEYRGLKNAISSMKRKGLNLRTHTYQQESETTNG